MEIRTLLAASVGPNSTTTPTIQHYKVDAADAPQVPNSRTTLRQNLNGNGLQFNFVTTGTVPQQVIDGFVAAGKLWSDFLSDDIVVNVQIGYSALGPGILGQTGSTSESISYSSFRSNLTADSKSTDDATAVSHLPAGPSLSLYTSSYTSGTPGNPVVDNNNTENNNFLDLNTALSKAVGLRAAGNSTFDAQMTFSSDFTWDFDRSDGIAPNAFDFVGVAAHEIGHALGFVSGADWVDYSTGFGPVRQNLDSAAVASGLDLFRFSASSISNGTNLDIRADSATKFFSIDGGTTRLTTFSTGSYNGDGRQASHWKDDLGIGIMDPTLDFGELPVITALDIKAFDVMGWDIRTDSGSNTAPVMDDQNLPNLNENVANGTIVGTVVASDVDAGQRLTYAIVDGNTGNAFAINPTTGQITVRNRLAVDYETNPVFQLTVQVTDNGSPAKFDTGFVTININDQNDLDFGDLPDTFGTNLASNGARHQTVTGLFLGAGFTNEYDGQPNTTASLDSDDGVTLPSVLTPGTNAQLIARASQAGRLDVFIDFNGNGVFESTERTTPVGGLLINAGSNVVTVSVPSTASLGQRGARFRLSSTGGLDATGMAPDGEVEDYFVTLGAAGPAYDYGDLPDTFGTILVSSGARHKTGGGLLLGTGVTSETDGKPGTAANLDNDDGVLYPAGFVLGNSALLKVRASRAGKLDAFIDFNSNGVFDANERVTPEGGQALVPGINSVTVNVPASAVVGQRGARFRLSTAGGLAATGPAEDGEVEDYLFRLTSSGPTYDYGDLPDTFGTLLASNGPRHQLGSGLTLGYGVTTDAGGQPNASANSDTDDGVKLPDSMTPGAIAQIEVTASKAGKLDAFIDFNGNGKFDADERVTPVGGQALTAGTNIVSLTVPTNASTGQLGARFRISTVGGLDAQGSAIDGEVEDYFVRVALNDFGDLPDTFGTTLAQDGARHLTGTGLYLGAGVTSDLNGLPSAPANRDRDDGVTFSSTLIAGIGARLSVVASQAGKLDAFIDFNGNGVFDSDERVTPIGGLALAAGTNSVYVEVPVTAVAGARAARFRLSSAGGLSANGAAADGEVEDYLLNVVSPGQDTIQLLPDPETPGQRLIYINGTSGNDTISVEKTNLGFTVRLNNKVSPNLDATSRILVYGGDGHDKITLPTSISLSAIVDGGLGNDSIWGGNGADVLRGGDGNDVIYARGGSDIVYGGKGNDTIIGDAKSHLLFGEEGNDKITGHGVLVGGAGTDTLVATGSRNVLIGGDGVDQLTAALGGDLLIGGTTNFDTNSSALQAILAEWSAAIAVNTRIAHLTGSLAGGLNGSFFLVSDAVRPGTVHDDLAIDTFTNTFAQDWLFVFPGDRRTRLVGIVNHS
ncbi:MAG: NF038122 family metalloprotease [Planctomycetaceae bacterium]